MWDEVAGVAVNPEVQGSEVEPFAARRLEGRGGGWTHLGGAAFIYVLWQVASLPLVFLLVFFGFSEALGIISDRVNWIDLAPDQDMAALVACAVLLLALVLLLLIVWLTVKLVHQRRLISILTAHVRFQWRSAFVSFASFIAAMLVVSIGANILGVGGDVETIFDPGRYFPFLVLVLVLTPFQALAEEAFVRGYLYQGISSFTASNILRIGLPAGLFMLMHSANSDFLQGGLWAILIFFTMGAYFGLLTVKTSGVEVSTGAHTANNIFAFSVSTTSGAGMPFATIFYEPEPDYMVGFVMIMLVAALHYLLYFRIFRSRFSS